MIYDDDSRASDVLEFTRRAPERGEIFKLVGMLAESGYPYFFNLDDDIKATRTDAGINLDAIDWENFPYHVELGMIVGRGFSELSIMPYTKDKSKLELLDGTHLLGNENATVDDALLYVNLDAAGVFRRIKKFFNAIPEGQTVYKHERLSI